MAARPQRERFTLVIEDAAPRGDSPVAVRLRLLLKRLLRTWGFRCVSCVAGGDRPTEKATTETSSVDKPSVS